MTYGNDDFTNRELHSEQLRADIEKTRARMVDDVEAIGNKLSPDQLKREAKVRIRRGFDERTRGLRTHVKHAGSSVRSNPVPFALIGLGVGWLLFDARRRSHGSEGSEGYELEELPIDEEYLASFGPEPVVGEAEPTPEEQTGGLCARAGERASELKSRAGERAGALRHGAKERAAAMRERARERAHMARERAHMARERAGLARDRAGQVIEDNPLALGAVALAAGIGIGMMLPATRREDRWFGERRDHLLGTAREKAHQVGEIAAGTARRTARAASDIAKKSAKEEARQRGLMGGAHHRPGQEEQAWPGTSHYEGESVAVTEVRPVGESSPSNPSGGNGGRS